MLGLVAQDQLVDVWNPSFMPHVRFDPSITLHHDAPFVRRARCDEVVARRERNPAVAH